MVALVVGHFASSCFVSDVLLGFCIIILICRCFLVPRIENILRARALYGSWYCMDTVSTVPVLARNYQVSHLYNKNCYNIPRTHLHSCTRCLYNK